MHCASTTIMLLVMQVSSATGWMGAPPYIPLRQEHIAELQFSIIVILKGGQAFRLLVQYVSNSGQFSPCIQCHVRVVVSSVLLQSRGAQLRVVESNSTCAAYSTIENACLKSQLAHILNPGWRGSICFVVAFVVVVATSRFAQQNVQHSTVLYY